MSTERVNSHNRRNGTGTGSPSIRTGDDGLSIQEAAQRVGVAASTLRRWARQGLLPRFDGSWSPAVVSHAKIVARLRDRGHSLKEIRQASDEGRLAYGYVEELFATGETSYTLAHASGATGLDPALIVRVLSALGTAPAQARAPVRGRPRAAPVRRRRARRGPAAGGATSTRACIWAGDGAVADAEVRLFHMYVHEPLMRSGATGLETAERDARAHAAAAAAVLAGDGRGAPALPPALRRAGRRRPHGVRPRGRPDRSRADARSDRVRRPDRIHAADRGAGRDRGGRRRRAVRRR